jgi:segregation and condensation protein B
VDESNKSGNEILDWQLIEAVLFSTNQPLSIPQLKKITGVKETGKIQTIISELNSFYNDHNRAYSILKVAGGYQLRTAARYMKWIRRDRIVKPIQLSPSAMETLAIVAYQQPVTRAEVEEIRSVDATYALRSLLDKKLIKITGRKEIPGRPILYGTSSHFLEVFGFNTINDLPRPEEFDILSESENEAGIDQTGEIS